MACTAFTAPNAGLFENASQGAWLSATESKGGRTCTHSAGALTISAPNGTINFNAGLNQAVRHKFFGTGNFLAVLVSDTTSGPVQHSMSIVDFTGATLTSKSVMFVGSTSGNSLPFLQHSAGTGSACLIGAPTPSGVAALAILRSDTGDLICAGPPPFVPTQQIIGETVGANVQIKHGGTIIGGPCPFPAGKLTVTPASQTFSTVKIGGCASAPSTKQFTLKNSGDDCLTISAIGNVAPFSVTATSVSLPAQLKKNETLTVTVTFAPTAAGSFNNVALPVTRSPAKGDDKLVCSGQAQIAQASFSVSSTVNFGTVRVGVTKNGTATITNNGDLPINVSVGGAIPGSPFQWAGFSGPLTCGQSINIPATFTPTAEGSASATMTVVSTPGGTKNITLTGVGCVPNAAIVVPPAPFPAFGNVRQGYRMPRFITIKNNGDDALTFTASISGPDAALFGIMKPSQSITDVTASRTFTVAPTFACGAVPIGDGTEELAIVFFANAAPSTTVNATLTIDAHNDASAPASFVRPLTATVIAGNAVDAVGVFDTSGSMSDAIPGGGTKMAAAIQAGKLFVSLIPPDLRNRVAATRFASTASTFLGIGEVTAANQAGKVAAIKDPPLTPSGSTAIAAGVMTALPEFAVPHAGGPPPNLTKAIVALTDGMDNTAFRNPADNKLYTISGQPAHDPSFPFNLVPTNPFVPPSDVKVYAVGLGTGQNIDTAQLSDLSSGAGGFFGAVDPTKPNVTFELMKFYTQIFMDLVDTASIKDPTDTIAPGDTHVIEFDVLQGDVSGIVVMYDIHGVRLPFWLETPKGEIVDASSVPPGFQLRSGFTDASRFLDFVLPWGDPTRYAGRWKLIVRHDKRACKGPPDKKAKALGFLPRDCSVSRTPIEYGFAIGVGSNFRLQAFLTPAPVNVGEPIRMTGIPTEAGLQVKGCTVTVDVTAPNGQQWLNLVLRDDGAHDDGDADDGEYARAFTHTAIAGSYTFTFRATGFTRDGEPVLRETVRSKYVWGTVRPPGGGGGGVSDDCCKRLIAVLSKRAGANAAETVAKKASKKVAKKASKRPSKKR